MKIRLGLARATEVPKLAAMARSLVEHGLPHTWDEQRLCRCLANSDYVALVARDGKRIAGFAVMEFLERRAHLALMAVDAAYQGHGVGRALLAWLEETARTAGTFLIHLEVRAGNVDARKFYERVGFIEAGRRRNYYAGGEDAVRMARDISVA
ncbi:MAG: ribosomal protein S18-alanine N-acetyltransferase [Gammaproteobacteria bacterium]|nr:ribosomal protein S18-alanine N-acetyltransferase [Gammaproteobacteria bacterium]